MKRTHTMRSFVYLTVGLALLFYALREMEPMQSTMSLVFTASWLGFAMLFIGSNLYYLIGVDKENRTAQTRRAWLARSMSGFRRGMQTSAAGMSRPGRGEQKNRRFMT